MSKARDLTDQRFGRFIVLERLGSDKYRNQMFLCKCDCGMERTVRSADLINGRSQSCGCKQREAASEWSSEFKLKHGHNRKGQRSPEYRAWCNMRNRCYNPKCDHFEYYGARGIGVFPAWNESFQAFLDYVGPRPSPKHSLDRVDNDGNYEPGNVRWATKHQQEINKTSSTLKREKVLHIKQLLASGLSQRRIAKQHGVSQQMISNIATGRSWSYLEERQAA